jgi:hypothetical protein
MSSILRPITVSAAVVATLAVLTGCSLLGGVSRGADGQVTESSDIKATELLTGDCFSYIGEGTDLSKVTVIPCADDHTFKVINQGTVLTTDADAAGGLQNAVSAACNESYVAFKAALGEGARTELSFLVSSTKVDEKEASAYSCVAVDPKINPAAEEPAEGDEG